jgi:transcription antitermination factor NusG
MGNGTVVAAACPRAWPGGTNPHFLMVGLSHMGVSPWFAIQVRSQCERLTAAALEGSGYEVFLPLYGATKIWSDRQKRVELPLFPGYLFVKTEAEDRRDVRIVTIGHVIRIVGFGGIPVPVDFLEIEALQAVSRLGRACQPVRFVQPGARIRIGRGPLKGIEGTVVRVTNACRLILSVSLLQRSVMVRLDCADLDEDDARALNVADSFTVASHH